jgi:hypothetical protein
MKLYLLFVGMIMVFLAESYQVIGQYKGHDGGEGGQKT